MKPAPVVTSGLNLALLLHGAVLMVASLLAMSTLPGVTFGRCVMLALGGIQFLIGSWNRKLINFSSGQEPGSSVLVLLGNALVLLLGAGTGINLVASGELTRRMMPAPIDYALWTASAATGMLLMLLAPASLLAGLRGGQISRAGIAKRWPALPPRRILNAIGPALGLVFVVGLFCLSSEVRPYFLTGANFKIILVQTVIVAIGALGMTMIIVSGGIDLSVGSVVALTSVVGATLLVREYSAATAIGLTILVGALIGLTNGLVVSGLRMMPFIVTLGMMGIARGAAKWLAGNQTVNAPPSAINDLMALVDPLDFFPLPPGVGSALALAVLMAVIMRQTVFGRYVFAIGSNESTARLCGVRVGLYKVLIYTVAGLFFGLSGLMQLSRLTQGDPTVAIGLELDIIAAVVIGGASLSGGTGSVFGSMIGALIMAVLRNGSNQMGWPNYMQEIIIGVVIILAVGLDRLRQSRAG